MWEKRRKCWYLVFPHFPSVYKKSFSFGFNEPFTKRQNFSPVQIESIKFCKRQNKCD